MGVGRVFCIYGKQKVRCYTHHPEIRLPLHLRVPVCDHCISTFPGAKSICNSSCFLRAASHLLGLSPAFPFDSPLNGYLETKAYAGFSLRTGPRTRRLGDWNLEFLLCPQECWRLYVPTSIVLCPPHLPTDGSAWLLLRPRCFHL